VNLPKKVTIVDVGPRDGFQMEPGFIPTEQKIQIIDRLAETGIKRIEATSFVHPKYVPQLADAEEVLAGIKKKEGVIYEALVPNARGVERAVKAGVEHVSMVVSASESHNKANVNMTVAESIKTLKEAVALARSHGIHVTAGIGTAFGCAIEGWVPPKQVEAVADEFLGLGVCELSLGDTPGLANPVQVSEMVRYYLQKLKGTERPGAGQRAGRHARRSDHYRHRYLRPGRLPLFAGSYRQHRFRGYGQSSGVHGH